MTGRDAGPYHNVVAAPLRDGGVPLMLTRTKGSKHKLFMKASRADMTMTWLTSTRRVSS